MKKIISVIYFGLVVTGCGGGGSTSTNVSNNLPPVPPQPIAPTIVCLGDSEVAGYTSPDKPGGQFVLDQSVSWPSQLNKLFGYTTTNYGVGGYTTEDVFNNEYRTALSEKSNIAIIATGINDAIHSKDISNVVGYYQSMIRGFKSQGTKVYVLTALDWPDTDVLTYRQAITSTAIKEGVGVIDIHSIMKPSWFPKNYDWHPSAEAYKEIAVFIHVELEKNKL